LINYSVCAREDCGSFMLCDEKFNNAMAEQGGVLYVVCVFHLIVQTQTHLLSFPNASSACTQHTYTCSRINMLIAYS